LLYARQSDGMEPSLLALRNVAPDGERTPPARAYRAGDVLDPHDRTSRAARSPRIDRAEETSLSHLEVDTDSTRVPLAAGELYLPDFPSTEGSKLANTVDYPPKRGPRGSSQE
jgi:hypothetical protein